MRLSEMQGLEFGEYMERRWHIHEVRALDHVVLTQEVSIAELAGQAKSPNSLPANIHVHVRSIYYSTTSYRYPLLDTYF